MKQGPRWILVLIPLFVLTHFLLWVNSMNWEISRLANEHNFLRFFILISNHLATLGQKSKEINNQCNEQHDGYT